MEENLQQRVRNLISLTWKTFSKKVGSELITINKEASMQLQYSNILNQSTNLIMYNKNEDITVELETGLKVDGRMREVDILVNGIESNGEIFNIALELKCYRTRSSSGGLRGAQDVFKKDVYYDLELLEKYIDQGRAQQGIELVMTDHKNFIDPKSKDAKSWDYDTSDGTQFNGITLDTPIGGLPVHIELHKSYKFKWVQEGEFWFLELEGK